MANFSTLVESFDTFNTTTVWTPAQYSLATVAGSELKISPELNGWLGSITSTATWTLDTSAPYGVVEFVPYAPRNNGVAGWAMRTVDGTGFMVEQYYDSNNWRASILAANGNATTWQYYTTSDRFWRFTGTPSAVAVQSSPDGKTGWTTQGTLDATGYWNGTEGLYVWLRITGGTGTPAVPVFRGINEPPPSLKVNAVVATASSRAPAPTAQQWTTVNVPAAAKASVQAPAPALKLTVDVAVAVATVQAPVPEILVPIGLSPPVMTATAAAVAPADVIAPAPTQVLAVAAKATCTAFVPVVDQLPNTTVNATVMAASIILLAPGDYVRISAPPALSWNGMLPLLRVGPALSLFAATVVQTPQNFGGAAVYYRLNDLTVTLTDTLGLHHGGWSGAHPLVTGAVANDTDKATQFNGTDTVAYNGVMPEYQPFRWTGGGFIDGGIVDFRADEWPRVWGWSAMAIFRTLPGATKQMYLLTRATQTLSVPTYDQSLRINQGRLIARFHQGNDWQEITAGPAVNDGNWHMAVLTIGAPLDDSTAQYQRCRLYLDSVLQGFLNFASPVSDRPLTLGGAVGTPSHEGALDDYAEYDYAVSQWEIRELWNQLNNLSGPPLYLNPPPAYARASMPAPSIRKSPVRPLNEFHDDFAAPFIDRTLWRDASPTARVISGSAVLRASGEQLLTADYFQARDSSFIVRIDQLPIREGHLFVGLVNENDIVPDAIFGGVNEYDAKRQHRTIGFDIYRHTTDGKTTTTITFSAAGEDFHGTSSRQATIPYIPNDPNYPSPMRWLRLDIDIGLHGGATWYTSPDGITWTDQYDVHGGKASSKTTLEKNPITGMPELVTKVVYEDVSNFYLFNVDDYSPATIAETAWKGYMRVKAVTDGGDKATDFRFDNVNVYPQGTGTPAQILAKHALVQTSSTTEYLLYALEPRIYSSAQDITIEAPVAWASVRALTPPEPVYVFTPVLRAQVTLPVPDRAGDALPVAIPAVPATAGARAVPPDRSGDAQDYHAEPNQATATFAANAPEVDTTQSKPAPAPGGVKQVITLKTRAVRVLVTQN